MATEENLRSISFDADASLGVYTGPPGLPGSAVPNIGPAQYRFCKVTGTRQVGRCTGSSDIVRGIVQNKPQVPGQATTVGYEGVSLLVAGVNNINAGDKLVPDAQGRGTNVSASAGVWQAIQPSSAVGELISVMKL